MNSDLDNEKIATSLQSMELKLMESGYSPVLFILLGGFAGGWSASDTSEFLSLDGSVMPGPNLPNGGRVYHCAVLLHHGKAMILGGSDNSIKKSAIIYDPSDNSFTDAPDMISGRAASGCALMRSNLHNNRPVVLTVGGYYGGLPEMLDYTTIGATWEQSKFVRIS